jgi:hypothetical protein
MLAISAPSINNTKRIPNSSSFILFIFCKVHIAVELKPNDIFEL